MNLKLVYILIFLLWSCDSVELPKPNAYLRLDFPSPLYKEANFEANGTTVELNTVSTYFTKFQSYFTYIGPQFSIKTKPIGKVDDRHSSVVRNDNVFSVYSGKVDNIFQASDYILGQLLEDNDKQ